MVPFLLGHPVYDMCINVSVRTLRRCFVLKPNYGNLFWTAGQRRDPSRVKSKFVWRVTTTDGYSKTSEMRYTNWYRGEPNNYRNGNEVCMLLWASRRYTWIDHNCSRDPYCSVCEIDM